MSVAPAGYGLSAGDQPGDRPAGPRARPPSTAGDAAIWAGLAAAATLLLPATLVAAPPLGRLLFPPTHVHFFPFFASLVDPQPAQQAAYLLAVALTIGAAIALARRGVRAGGGRIVGVASLAAKLGAAALAAWCFRRYELADEQARAGHFTSLALLGGLLVALLAAGVLRWRPGLVAARPAAEDGARRWVWPAAAAVVTGCWLLPAVFTDANIGHSLFAMWWHMQFVFGDFVAVVNGRTPLVDYNAEYGSLVPLVVAGPLRWVGVSVGSFTVLMCGLSLAALAAVERSLALVARSERLALVLYLPVLAAGFFTDVRVGAERFYFGNYYGVFPLRYLGPYVLLWLCLRHLRGLAPRRAGWVFFAAGLGLLDDIEFGLPALAAAVLALAAASPRGDPVRGWLPGLLRALAVGLAGALAVVAAGLWLRTGQLIDVAYLTRYARLFGLAGFGGLPTPRIGLHLVIYATFTAVLILAALRHRQDAPDRTLTGALAFAGVFGLGAGSHFMSPNQLIVGVFSAWGVAVALLALLALRALAAWREDPAARPPLFAAAAALVLFGLLATSLTQFPSPWTQLRRITTTATTQPYDRTAASAFVRRTARRDEPVVVLEDLGPLIAEQAGVANVSPYSEVSAVWSREQVAEIIAALRRSHGTRFYLGQAKTDPVLGLARVDPEIPAALSAAGFTNVAHDPPSGLTEWRR